MSLGAWSLARTAVLDAPRLARAAPSFSAFQAAGALVVLIVVLYEASELVGVPWPLDSQEFAPIALFVIPMLYATRTLGRVGAWATGTWVVLLVVLDVVLARQGAGRWSDGLQVAIIGTVTLFVGRRVEHELRVRRRAEAASEALRASETRYRSLFEQSQTPILLAEHDGVILEANGAADALFGMGARGSRRRSLQALLGTDVADRLLTGKQSEAVTLSDADGGDVTVQPRSTLVGAREVRPLFQVVLQDITAERRQRRRLDTYAMRILRAHEDERRTIAQEIHDEPIQALISLCRRLDAIADRDTLPARTVVALDETRSLVEGVARNLRDLARGLRPPSLDDLGLVPAVRRLLLEFEERTTVATSFRVRGEVRRLAPEVELGLYRIIQEALHNVDRHAAARHVAVGLAFSESVRVIVGDDGVGFPLATSGNGLGLLGIEERASLLGGRLVIRSSVGHGTRLRVAVPTPGVSPSLR